LIDKLLIVFDVIWHIVRNCVLMWHIGFLMSNMSTKWV